MKIFLVFQQEHYCLFSMFFLWLNYVYLCFFLLLRRTNGSYIIFSFPQKVLFLFLNVFSIFFSIVLSVFFLFFSYMFSIIFLYCSFFMFFIVFFLNFQMCFSSTFFLFSVGSNLPLYFFHVFEKKICVFLHISMLHYVLV